MGSITQVLTYFILLCEYVNGRGFEFQPNPIKSGEWVKQTQGEIWPKPQYQTKSSFYMELNPKLFDFDVRMFTQLIFKVK